MDQRRLHYIDTLRAVAAVGVVIFHIRVITKNGPLATPDWLHNFIDQIGDAGVPLFFVISAFLLSMLMPTYQRSTHPLIAFYIKRYFRIAPLFYAATVVWAYDGGGFAPWPILLTNWTFTFNLFPSTANSSIFAGWTIGVEFLFYAIFPLLYLVLSNLPLKLAAFCISLPIYTAVQAVIEHNGIDPVYELLTFFRSLPIFLLGMIAFDVFEKIRRRPEAASLAVLLLCGAIAIFDLIVTHQIVLIAQNYWQAIACVLLLIALGLRRFPGVNDVTAFVGRISYSIYLFHGFIIIKMSSVLHAIYGFGLPDVVSFALAVLLALAVIIPVSALSYALVERPGNVAGRAIVRWMDQRRRPAIAGGQP